MNEFDIELKSLNISYLNPPKDFDEKIEKTLSTMYRRENKKKSNIQIIIEKIVRFFIMLLSLLTVTSAAIYTGNAIYDKYIQKNLQKNEDNEVNYNILMNSLNEDEFTKVNITSIDSLYYKLISNIDKYNELKDLWESFPIMTEKDFKDKSLLLVVWSNPKNGLKVENIEVIGNITNITFSDKDMVGDNSVKHSSLGILIDNNLIKDEFKFNTIPGTDIIKNYGYTLMSDITTDYIENVAKNEGCVITDWNTNVLYNEDNIAKFIKNTENNINSAIRSIQIYDEKDSEFIFGEKDALRYLVIDTIYENGAFNQYITIYGKDDKIYESCFQKDGIKIIYEEDENENRYYIEYPEGNKQHMIHTSDVCETK